MTRLFMDYVRDGKPYGLTFRQFIRAVGYSDPAADTDGMDDGAVAVAPAGGPMMVSVPRLPLAGPLRIVVLLVDFPDQPGTRPARRYEDLLFSDRVYPTGSLRDYFREVSGGAVDVSGTVHGWLRLPSPLSYYAAGTSGTRGAYPRNARRMAEDAVAAAVAAGVAFDPALDALGTGTITGLFIVHAGRGAEVLDDPAEVGGAIWSHKWDLRTPADVGPNLAAATYLTVPEDCLLGVCAHELGHLAFQWEDYYDPNGGDDGVQWAGSGRWDLMAGGSYNGDGGARPAHPMGLHKSQHGWVRVETVDATRRLEIAPYSPTGGTVYRVVGPHFGPTQFLLLENRRRAGFDDRLPGEGLLVWRVDLSRDQNAPSRPALQLVQADGRQDLELSAYLNQGDSGDPFPGATRRDAVSDTGLVSTSFPGGPNSGITLSDITLDPTTGAVGVTVTIAQPPEPAPPARDGEAAPEPPACGAVGADAGAEKGVPVVDEAAAPLREVGAVPAEPARMVAAGLGNVLRCSRVSAAELEPLVRAVTPTALDLQKKVLAAEAGVAPMPRAGGPELISFAGRFADPSSFDGWWFRRYKANFGVAWDLEGRFEGVFDPARHLTPRGGRDYLYTPDRADPFRFVRSTGERIQPGHMITDGGSVPRAAWVIPDINPWAYIKAYLIHDWDFSRHHCDAGYGRLFDPVNRTLGEGIYTLMRLGEVATDWRKVELVYQAVSSFVGRGVWDRQWEAGACPVALPGGDPPGTT
jgi:immune inhibitor A